MRTTSFVFIGIDVSKKTLDLQIDDMNTQEDIQIQNQTEAIKHLFGRLEHYYPESTLLVCMENTGQYNWNLLELLLEFKQTQSYLVNPVHLKRSMGLRRGKTDKLDARAITRFIRLHHQELTPSRIPRPIIRQIQVLLTERNRLVKVLSQLRVPLKELQTFNQPPVTLASSQFSKPVIESLKSQIKAIEKELNRLIASDPQLHDLSKHVGSVTGVGPVTTWSLLVKTNEFKSLSNPRKLACYAGIAPFEHQSGTSIRRRPKVSHYADKELKKLLHLAAMRSIQIKGEFMNYYNRKLEEGKNEMLVLNAVRNKIVSRVCAVVKGQRMYEPLLTLS